MYQVLRVSAFVLAAIFACHEASAQSFRPQQPGQARPGNRPGGNNNNNNQWQQEGAPSTKLPDDPRLLEIHKQFVTSAEKLAQEYERANQSEKARAVYEEILRLVPTYPAAVEKLQGIKAKEATAERRQFDVFANKGWQDTGVNVAYGKPVSIRASGVWTMKMTYDGLSPDGVEIPKELRDFPLGALVGMIATSPNDDEPKLFLIGTSYTFNSDRDGRLFLRMYDSVPEDNIGKLGVTIEGTFKK